MATAEAARAANAAHERLRRLTSYLQVDPANLALLADTAETALAAGDPQQADEILHRYAVLRPLPPKLLNLRGVIALYEQRFDAAAAAFAEVIATGAGDPAAGFNLAWARAMLNDYEGALAALDRCSDSALPAAAVLRIRMLHQLGRLDEALDVGRALAERFPAEAGLMGALAIVAMDSDKPALAATYARRGGEDPDALATLGMLDLDADRLDQARGRFDRALAASPDSARALLGKGLDLMIEGRPGAAADRLDRAAALFDTHLGSWIAAGWAHFLAGDLTGGRASFERALARDDRFAEAHGGLAVLDIAEGRLAEGGRRMEVALRLDRDCLSGALAKVMLLDRSGRSDVAARIRDIALNRPLDPSGRTLAQAMVRLAAARTRRL